MSVGQEVAGVTLQYVAREVTGDIMTTAAQRDAKNGGIVERNKKLKEPVIVFFSNGSTLVMERSSAETRGFLKTPEVMNLSQVTDTATPAGRFKHAFRDEDRQQAWMDLEQAVITKCTSRSGHPLPLDARVSEQSIYFPSVQSVKEKVT